MKIKVLSDDTINKIAAGEVIERPASIVKELVENSLDAGAKQIDVEVKSGGKTLIRVSDDGCGMDKDDAVLSFERHATSKINTADDLETINSLGFRGEALPSIASISKVELITRSKAMDSAVKIRIEGGKMLEVKETGAPSGTMINVQNIFYNTPARRKFLKSNITEFSHIIDVVGHYSLVFTECGFTLEHNGERVIEIYPKDSLRDRIKMLYGNEVAENLLEVNFNKDGIILSGYVGKPVITYPNRSYQIIFVNKRPILNRSISYAIYEAYNTLIPKGRFAAVVLFLDISPSSIDVNVHPAKREIKFGDERFIQGLVRDAILNALGVQRIDSSAPDRSFISSSSEQFYAKTDKIHNTHFNNYDRAGDESASVGLWRVQENFSAFDAKADGVKAVQMNNAYIIVETDKGFDIMDQHAVHERILYEKIKIALSKKNPESQRLLLPVNIDLTPSEQKTLKISIPFLKEIGFNIEEFGARSVIIDMIPVITDKLDIKKFLKDLLSEVKDLEKDFTLSKTSKEQGLVFSEKVKDDIIKIIACRSAIKKGDRLENSEVQKLINNWRKLTLPYTCPHGRPASIEMSSDDLDKKFHRT